MGVVRRGVVYIVYGEAARREALASLESLRVYNDWPVAVIGEAVRGVENIPFDDRGARGRWAKVNLERLSPFEQTLYLDADTRVNGRLTAGFEMLGDGWELVFAPSARQGHDVMGHLPPEERGFTIEYLANEEPLQFQAGVFFFGRGERVNGLFAAWREEWQRFRDQDQGALLRALRRYPVRVWVLGLAWNSARGPLVEHLFGRAR